MPNGEHVLVPIEGVHGKCSTYQILRLPFTLEVILVIKALVLERLNVKNCIGIIFWSPPQVGTITIICCPVGSRNEGSQSTKDGKKNLSVVQSDVGLELCVHTPRIANRCTGK